MAYELTADERALVAATLADCPPDELPRTRHIHETQLLLNRERLKDLMLEVGAIERAIAMRALAVELIGQRA